MPVAAYPFVPIIYLRLKLGLERPNFSFPRISLSLSPPLLIYSFFLSFTPLFLLLLRCDCKQSTNTSATAHVCAPMRASVSAAAKWASLSVSAILRFLNVSRQQ